MFITKLWQHFLPFAGNGIKYRANDIVNLYNEKNRLEKKLQELTSQIIEEENELFELIKNDWTDEEIQYAKEKYQNHLNQ